MKLYPVAMLALTLQAQSSWFSPQLLEQPVMRKAFESVQAREPQLIAEWIQLTETAAPSTKEQSRATWIRAELTKLNLTELRADEMGNISAVRKGTGSA